MLDMKRREFIALVGGGGLLLTAKVRRARAQQPAMPIVSFVEGRSAEASVRQAAAFRKSLSETGYVEGQNVMVEYHWLDGQYDSLAGAHGRSRAPSRGCDRLVRQCSRACGQSCDHDDPDRLRRRPRPGEDGSCCEPCAAGRQCDRYQFFQPGGWRQAA